MIDKTQWPFSDPDMELHDLGHDVYWTKVDYEGQWVGILEWHQCNAQNVTDSDVTAGGVNFENAPAGVQGPRWKLEQAEPLTISPSVLCRTCGLHGWIRDGKWVPA
jgi:hypothetical protein